MHSFLRSGLLALACALVTVTEVAAQAAVSEAQAKAAFVLNFARYVEWPERVFAARDAPLLLCVLGRDEVATALNALEGRQVQGRPIAVRRLTSADEARPCQVLFIAESEARRLALVLRAVAGQPLLTVSDADAFIDAGGAIGIVRGDGRLQFEVNRLALDQAQLKASSNLLKLARNLAEAKGRN
ncbi:MAG: YfiR family protein [Candidatus Accumulibacter sp.]|uniref:YfiR family protein n=1 Tax=Candidatus Accumulibacter proximus TaxID=2954385 RepID=A0A935PW97_9PROT|nr:YfiR family protein [Candidatus Accumulibacter proximus]